MDFEGLNNINESKSDNLYFISENNMDGKILQPRIPNNYFTQNGYEENQTKRVCFSTSIDKCLMALSMNCKGKEYYVHQPVGEYTIINPTIKDVPDSKITGEKWITSPVKIKCVSKIKVLDDDGKDGKKFNYGENRAELYGWKWEYINESNLNKFTKVDLNEFNIKKYKSSCKGLSHIRTGSDYKGKIYLENNKVVGFYNIRISDNYLQGIEINEQYRSKGLGKELLKESIREGVRKLSVNKKNKKAINMYKKDFTIIDQDNTMYYMELKSSNNTIGESITNENYFMSKDDKYLNLDKFESGESNICLVVGLDGSNKNQIARKIANDNDALYVNLNLIKNYCLDNVSDSMNIKDNKIFKDYFKTHSNYKAPHGKKYGRAIVVDDYIPKVEEDFVKKYQYSLLHQLNEKIKKIAPTLSRGVLEKKGPGVNGKYNQDFNKNTILIEVGGQYNYIEEVNNTLKIISKVIYEYLEDEKEN